MNVQPPTTAEMWRTLRVKFGSLMEDFDFKQENGQRKLTRVYKAGSNRPGHQYLPPPVEGSEVFIGRLPRDLFEDELLVPFLKIGRIFELRLMMNFSGVTRGFAFIRYMNVKCAKIAIQALNSYEIRPGHKIGVLMSLNNRHLLVGPVLDMYPYYPLQEQEVLLLLQQETPGVEKVTMLPFEGGSTHRMFVNNQPTHKWFKNMVLHYKTHRDAALARRILIPKKNVLFGVIATVDWAGAELLKSRIIR